MSVLTAKTRNALPDSAFVFPKERKYPIHDETHARNALSRVAQNGTAAEKAAVHAAVRKKYPNIGNPDADQEMSAKDRISAWKSRRSK
jgi:hypothetical protein